MISGIDKIKVYRTTVYKAHVGAGILITLIVYVFAKDCIEADHILYERVRGWKRHYGILNMEDISEDNKSLQVLMDKFITTGYTLDYLVKRGYFKDTN